jgi:hypothetical protein
VSQQSEKLDENHTLDGPALSSLQEGFGFASEVYHSKAKLTFKSSKKLESAVCLNVVSVYSNISLLTDEGDLNN